MTDRTPFLKLYGDDWSHGTRMLTMEQKGFFLECLLLMWDRKGGLPCDPAWLSGALQIDPRMARRLTCDLIRLGKLADEDGMLVNPRMMKDLSTRQKKSESAKDRAELPEKSPEDCPELRTKKPEKPIETTEHPSKQKAPIFQKPDSIEEIPPKSPKGGPSPLDALKAFEAYNATALRCGLPQASTMSKDRQRKIIARLRDYGLDGWAKALANVEKSSFLTGKNDRGWRANLDWLVGPEKFGKVHDGSYGNGRHAETKPAAVAAPPPNYDVDQDQEFMAAMAKKYGYAETVQ